MRKWYLLGFGISAPTTLLAAILLLLSLIPTPKVEAQRPVINNLPVFEAQNMAIPVITAEIYSADARPEIIRKYLKKYHSPLEPFADQVVEIGDKYDIDPRLLVAIAQQESNLCKKAPESSDNCWGFGIHSGKVTSFDDYPQAVDAVARWLAKKAKAGMETPEKIMVKYNPPSIESGTGAWAKGVNQFLQELQ